MPSHLNYYSSPSFKRHSIITVCGYDQIMSKMLENVGKRILLCNFEVKPDDCMWTLIDNKMVGT
jgi:hypothetical protein